MDNIVIFSIYVTVLSIPHADVDDDKFDYHDNKWMLTSFSLENSSLKVQCTQLTLQSTIHSEIWNEMHTPSPNFAPKKQNFTLILHQKTKKLSIKQHSPTKNKKVIHKTTLSNNNYSSYTECKRTYLVIWDLFHIQMCGIKYLHSAVAIITVMKGTPWRQDLHKAIMTFFTALNYKENAYWQDFIFLGIAKERVKQKLLLL